VVTGAASGIGREAARVLALAGARIIGADIAVAGLEETGAMIRAAGGWFSGQVVDVADKAAVERLADTAVAEAGALGHGSDIAYAPVYLASAAGSFVTGQVLRVNGGESM
jgi:NAD(P)-dependent dehydrogenase (short-subunit alcohol dehydrogenase family)